MANKVYSKNIIGNKYELALNFISVLYHKGKYKIEKSIADEKGRGFRCYLCLQQIKKEHIRFDIENKESNSIFTV